MTKDTRVNMFAAAAKKDVAEKEKIIAAQKDGDAEPKKRKRNKVKLRAKADELADGEDVVSYVISLPASYHAALKQAAVDEHASMSTLILDSLWKSYREQIDAQREGK